jgi:hypothetical protein
VPAAQAAAFNMHRRDIPAFEICSFFIMSLCPLLRCYFNVITYTLSFWTVLTYVKLGKERLTYLDLALKFMGRE